MPSGLGHSFSYSIHIKEFTDPETYLEPFQTSKMERPVKIYVPVTNGLSLTAFLLHKNYSREIQLVDISSYFTVKYLYIKQFW